MKVFLFVCLVLFSSFCEKKSMIWMCLERCGDTKEDINKQLEIIKHHAPTTLTSMSFEIYNIGPNSQLISNNNLTVVAPTLSKINGVYGKPLELYPMVSSYPYPPQLMDWIRELFKNPDPFINKCIEEAKTHGFKGFNLDFEPTEGATEQDGKDYATFITTMSDRLKKAGGYEVTVDASTFSKLWNFDLLNLTTAERIIDMQGYAYDHDLWDQVVGYALDHLSLDILGMGLCPHCNASAALTDEEIEYRFGKIESDGIQEVDIWRMTVEDLGMESVYWKQLSNFFHPKK